MFWLALGLIALAAVALRAAWLHSFPLSPDEGIHLIWLRLLAAGYRPYSEVYITYPPLYPMAIAALWQFWPTEEAQRWFSVAYTLFGATGIALLGRKFGGPVVGVAAAALTLFSPVLLEPSVAILGEFPAVAWSVWAIWLAWLAKAPPSTSPFWTRATGRRLLLSLSGLCLAASLLTKLLLPFVVVLIPLLLIVDSQSQADARSTAFPPANFRLNLTKTKLIDLLVWGLALLLPGLILLSVYDIGPLFEQVVDQRLRARTVYEADESFWPPRYERATQFWQEDAALVILGVAGIGLAWRRRLPGLWLLLAWLALALAMLAIHNPIRYKHFLILIPPLAIFGGVTIDFIAANLKAQFFTSNTSDRHLNVQAKRSSPETVSSLSAKSAGHFSASCGHETNRRAKAIAVAGVILLLALYLWQIPAALSLWQVRAALPQPPPDEVEALAFITAVTAPDDCLISDDMQLLYWSGRLTPPELAEVSTNRLKSGALTLPELVRISDTYNCQLVAAVSNRLPQYLPAYMDWVKQKYLGRFHYGEDDLYFAKIDTDPNPATPLWADFAGQIIFHGYTLPPEATAPGDRLPLTLVWQAQDAPDADYAIFVQLRDAQNNILAGADHQPYLGLLPTSTWPAGAVIQEVTWLELPAELPAGQYRLYTGLYRPATLERLPLINDSSGENALILGPVVVE